MRIATLRHQASGLLALAFADDETTWFGVAEAARALDHTLAPAQLDPRANAWMTPEGLAVLAALDKARREAALTPLPAQDWRLWAPVPAPGKIIAVGRNYMDHVREGQEIWAKRGKVVALPTFPSAFAKFPSSLTGPFDDIVIPEGLDDVDYEVELAVVIGRPALNVAEADALGYVAGYAICNDVATRGIQRREMEAQVGIALAKNFPGFAPLGPWVTTADAIPDPQALEISLTVDGDRRQQASTSDMIFPVAHLVAYWSRVGLYPGDILITGTPSGVALARENPQDFYLRPGQTVVAEIAGLGALRNRVR